MDVTFANCILLMLACNIHFLKLEYMQKRDVVAALLHAQEEVCHFKHYF